MCLIWRTQFSAASSSYSACFPWVRLTSYPLPRSAADVAVIKEKLYIGEAPIATVIGIIMGPYVSGVFDPLGWAGGHSEITDEITLEVTRVIIAISVFAVGVELPKVS